MMTLWKTVVVLHHSNTHFVFRYQIQGSHFLVSISHHALMERFGWVPMQFWLASEKDTVLQALMAETFQKLPPTGMWVCIYSCVHLLCLHLYRYRYVHLLYLFQILVLIQIFCYCHIVFVFLAGFLQALNLLTKGHTCGKVQLACRIFSIGYF